MEKLKNNNKIDNIEFKIELINTYYFQEIHLFQAQREPSIQERAEAKFVPTFSQQKRTELLSRM